MLCRLPHSRDYLQCGVCRKTVRDLKDLKWMGSYTKKAISSENEVDTSLKGMMTMSLV